MSEFSASGDGFEFRDKFRFHLHALLDFHPRFFPVSRAFAVAGLFTNVLVDDVVDFGFVLVRDSNIGFLEDAVEPFSTIHFSVSPHAGLKYFSLGEPHTGHFSGAEPSTVFPQTLQT